LHTANIVCTFHKKNWCAVWVKLAWQIGTECVIVHI